MSKAMATILLDRLVAAELRVAEISRDRADISSELEDLKEAYNELDERNTVLVFQQAEVRKRCEDFELLKARVAEMAPQKQFKVNLWRKGMQNAALHIDSVNSSNGVTTITVRDFNF